MSTWRLKVDEDLSEDVTHAFEAAGHDVTSVFRQAWCGKSDDDLWPMIVSEQRWLVTADKGIADTRRLQRPSALGIILLRLQKESRAGYVALARSLIQSVDLHTLSPAIIVVSETGIRVHRL